MPSCSPYLGSLVHADIENSRWGHDSNSRFTKVVLPDPEGAVITIILPVAKCLNYPRIKQKKAAYTNRTKNRSFPKNKKRWF